MSLRAYLDSIEDKTGLVPRALTDQAKERGYDAPTVKAGTIVAWLAQEYGPGLAMPWPWSTASRRDPRSAPSTWAPPVPIATPPRSFRSMARRATHTRPEGPCATTVERSVAAACQ